MASTFTNETSDHGNHHRGAFALTVNVLGLLRQKLNGNIHVWWKELKNKKKSINFPKYLTSKSNCFKNPFFVIFCTFKDSSWVNGCILTTLTLFFEMTSSTVISWVVTSTLAQTSKLLMIWDDHTSSNIKRLLWYWPRKSFRRISLAYSTVVTDATWKILRIFVQLSKTWLSNFLTQISYFLQQSQKYFENDQKLEQKIIVLNKRSS